MATTHPVETIAKLLILTERRVQQLAREGILPKPMLWIPMSHAPKRAGGERLTAAAYVRTIGPLVTIRRPGKPPMLAGQVRENSKGRITPAKLRSARRHVEKKGGAGVRLIPLFTGVSTVTIRKRFAIYAVIERARGRLASYYLANLKD